MKPPFPSFGVVCFLLYAMPLRGEEIREWTRAADGRKIRAEFAGMKDESTVKIKTTKGQVFEAPLAGLSAEDKEYVKEAAARAGSLPMPRGGATAVTLAGAHLCCDDCVDAVAKIVSDAKGAVPEGVVIVGDRSAGSIHVEAPSDKAARLALDAILGAGFYGVSDHATLRIPDLVEDDRSVDVMLVQGAHLCCGGCVREFTAAVESVDGVENCEARKGEDAAKVTGKGFKPYEVMRALRESGFGGSFQ